VCGEVCMHVACVFVCVCVCVCVGASVWQTLGNTERPRDVPWADVNLSEGSRLCTRLAWDLARMTPENQHLPLLEDSGPVISQLRGIQTRVLTFTDQEAHSGQGDQPL
jgi:hypothetical protein